MTLIKTLPRFRKAYASLSQYAERESWSRNSIEQFQLERLNMLWKHATAHVPYYRRLSRARSLPASFESLRDYTSSVPILPKSHVRSDAGDFVSERADPGDWKYTGGTTATPTKVFRSRAAHHEMLRARYRFYQMWDVDIFDRWVFLWGHAASFAPGWAGFKNRIAQPLVDRMRRRIRLSAYDLGRDDLRRYLKRIKAFRPAAIYAYSTAGYLLALEAQELGFTCGSLKMVNLTAEPVPDFIVRTAESAFGVPAVAEYGSVECGFLAGEWPDRTLRIREDEAFLESLKRDDGQYDIIVTVLGNPSFPLLRYRIEDVTDRPIEYPEQGFAILHCVAGRNIDTVRTKTGRFLHGFALEHLILPSPGFRRWRVHQHADGSVSVLVEKLHAVEDATLICLKRKLEKVLEGYDVDIRLVEALPVTPSGKHRVITSDLSFKVGSTSDPFC